jgi:hypothetical protein
LFVLAISLLAGIQVLQRDWRGPRAYCRDSRYGSGSIPINTIFSGMNIHLPAILMFTRGTWFWPIPISWYIHSLWFTHFRRAPGVATQLAVGSLGEPLTADQVGVNV